MSSHSVLRGKAVSQYGRFSYSVRDRGGRGGEVVAMRQGLNEPKGRGRRGVDGNHDGCICW